MKAIDVSISSLLLQTQTSGQASGHWHSHFVALD
jgi:hypothetical protein